MVGLVLRKEDGDVVRNALEFNVEGRRKIEQPKRAWREQEEERLKAGLNLRELNGESASNFHEVNLATSNKWDNTG